MCIWGMMADHENMTHKIDLESHGLKCFDLGAVNLSIQRIVKNPTHTEAQAIDEKYEGGVSLIRAASKKL